MKEKSFWQCLHAHSDVVRCAVSQLPPLWANSPPVPRSTRAVPPSSLVPASNGRPPRSLSPRNVWNPTKPLGPVTRAPPGQGYIEAATGLSPQEGLLPWLQERGVKGTERLRVAFFGSASEAADMVASAGERGIVAGCGRRTLRGPQAPRPPRMAAGPRRRRVPRRDERTMAD